MSEPRVPFGFAWSPPGAGYLGAIIIAQLSRDRLTAPTYWSLLARRINRLVADVPYDEWRRQSLERLRANEPWVDDRHLDRIGDVMVETSEWLRDRVCFPLGGVRAAELVNQPETKEALIDDCLEQYIAELYYDGAG